MTLVPYRTKIPIMKPQSIISLVGRIRRSANEVIVKSLLEKGLEEISPSHGDILVILFQERSVPMKVIAQRIDRKKNTVTVLVNKLITLGYVNKRTSDEDNRVQMISLTSKGKTLKSHFEEISERLITGVYYGFSEAEKDDLIRLLERVLQNLQERSRG